MMGRRPRVVPLGGGHEDNIGDEGKENEYELRRQAKIMDDLFLDTDACLTGAKMDIGAKERRMTELELHKRKGHIGSYH
eukprot:COSAG05_NODE_21_length_32397_cov_125.224008_4_plen_79_part_00